MFQVLVSLSVQVLQTESVSEKVAQVLQTEVDPRKKSKGDFQVFKGYKGRSRWQWL